MARQTEINLTVPTCYPPEVYASNGVGGWARGGPEIAVP